jgi:hypothetical protein
MKTKIRLLILFLLVSTGISIPVHASYLDNIELGLETLEENLITNFSPDITTYHVKLPRTQTFPCFLGLAVSAPSNDNNVQLFVNDEFMEDTYNFDPYQSTVLYTLFGLLAVLRVNSLPLSIKLQNGDTTYEIIVEYSDSDVKYPNLSVLFLTSLSQEHQEYLPNFSPNITDYVVELPSDIGKNINVVLFAAVYSGGNAKTLQLRIDGELITTSASGLLEYDLSLTVEKQPVLLELVLVNKVYKITIIRSDAYLSQLSLKCNNRELLKDFNNKIHSYSAFVADDLNSQMIPVKWETSFLQGMTVQLNGQPLDSCVFENFIQKCHGTQLINKDSLKTLEFKVLYRGDTATYNVQLQVDVKVPATKLTIQGNDGTLWDLDPSPEVLSEYDMNAYYRNNEGILEKLLYLNIDQPIDSIRFNVEAPSGYNIAKPEGWHQINYGNNEFDVQTSRGIHKMNYHIIVDRGTIINMNVAYIVNYLNLSQEVAITEQERRYGTNSDTLIYVVPASATNIKIAANNVQEDIIMDNTSNLGTFALSSPDMQFLVKGENRYTGIKKNIVVRVLKDIVSLNNFSVTVHKKGQPNTTVPICVFPQFSPEVDTYMCILPESEFEERTLRITTQYQNTGQVEINGFRIGNVQHDGRYAFIKAFPDTSFHSLTNHQSNIQNSLRTDNFSVDSEVSAHQVHVDSLGGDLRYKIEKQLDGYYFITVKNGNVCKVYNLVVVSVNHAKIINSQMTETTPDENRYMGLLNPLNGELRFTRTGIYNNVDYKYINYTEPEMEYADLFSALSSNSNRLCPFLYVAGGGVIVIGSWMLYYSWQHWPSRSAGNLHDTERLIDNANESLDLTDLGSVSPIAPIVAEGSGSSYVIGFAGGAFTLIGLADLFACAVKYCRTDACYSDWKNKWKYSNKSDIQIKTSTDATMYQNLGDYNTIHVYPWSSNSEATFNVNGVGNEFIIYSTSSNHATLHFTRPALCTLSSAYKSLSEKEKNNRLAYRKNQKGTDMKLQIINGANANTITIQGDLHVNMELNGNNNKVYSERKLLVDIYGQSNTIVCDSAGNGIRCTLNTITNDNSFCVSGSQFIINSSYSSSTGTPKIILNENGTIGQTSVSGKNRKNTFSISISSSVSIKDQTTGQRTSADANIYTIGQGTGNITFEGIHDDKIYIERDNAQVTLNNTLNNTINLLGYSGTGTLTNILNQYKDKVITRTINLTGNSQNNFLQGPGYNSNNKPAGKYEWTLQCNINGASDKNKVSISNWNTVSIINNGQPYNIFREVGAYELILNCQKAGMSIHGTKP